MSELDGRPFLDILLLRPEAELQAGLRVELRDAASVGNWAVLDADGSFELEGERNSTLEMARKLRVARPRKIEVVPAAGLTWGRVIEVLGRLDRSCDDQIAVCRQPGLKTRVLFPRAPGSSMADAPPPSR